MIANVDLFEGEFKRINKSAFYTNRDGVRLDLALCKRKFTTPKKPEDFLMYSIDKARPQYFSSLFIEDEGCDTGKVEFGGQWYDVQFKAATVVFTKTDKAAQL